MKVKSFSHEGKYLEVEDEKYGATHRMSFDFIDDFVRFLMRSGYMQIPQAEPEMLFTHRWTGDTSETAHKQQAANSEYDLLNTDDRSRFTHKVEEIRRELTALHFLSERGLRKNFDPGIVLLLLADINNHIGDLQQAALFKSSLKHIGLGENLRNG